MMADRAAHISAFALCGWALASASHTKYLGGKAEYVNVNNE